MQCQVMTPNFLLSLFALPLDVVVERMNEEIVDLEHFTMSVELTTWALCELSFYYLFLFAVCAFVDSKM